MIYNIISPRDKGLITQKGERRTDGRYGNKQAVTIHHMVDNNGNRQMPDNRGSKGTEQRNSQTLRRTD